MMQTDHRGGPRVHPGSTLFDYAFIMMQDDAAWCMEENKYSVLKEKRVFSEFQKSEPTPEPSTLSDLEKTLQEKIKLYEELIADAQGED